MDLKGGALLHVMMAERIQGQAVVIKNLESKISFMRIQSFRSDSDLDSRVTDEHKFLMFQALVSNECEDKIR